MGRMPFPVGMAVRITILSLFTAPFAAHAFSVQEINDPAPGFDRLWNEVMIDITILGVIFALVTAYFLVRYRRRTPDQEGSPPKLTPAMALGWAIIPAFIFMADDFFLAAKGWQLWNAYRDVPADRLEVKLETYSWGYDYTYPNGVENQDELRVPAGKPVLLRMTSRDVVHSHFIPDFRVKEDAMPGRVTYLWFYPKEPGEHIVTCAEYCGVMHSYMAGRVIVMPPDEFDRWYEQEGAKVANRKINDVRG